MSQDGWRWWKKAAPEATPLFKKWEQNINSKSNWWWLRVNLLSTGKMIERTITLMSCTFYTTYYRLNPHKKRNRSNHQKQSLRFGNKAAALILCSEQFVTFPQCWTRDELASLITMGCASDCRPRGLGWDYCYSLCEQQGSVEWHSSGISLLCAAQAGTCFCIRGGLEKLNQWKYQRFCSLVCLFGKGWHSVRIGQRGQIERFIYFSCHQSVANAVFLWFRAEVL